MVSNKIEAARQQRLNQDNALRKAYGFGVDVGSIDWTIVDDIHRYNRKRIQDCLNELHETINAKTKDLLFTTPELHKLINEKRSRDLKDLEYLLNQTKMYENPAEITRKILH